MQCRTLILVYNTVEWPNPNLINFYATNYSLICTYIYQGVKGGQVDKFDDY